MLKILFFFPYPRETVITSFQFKKITKICYLRTVSVVLLVLANLLQVTTMYNLHGALFKKCGCFKSACNLCQWHHWQCSAAFSKLSAHTLRNHTNFLCDASYTSSLLINIHTITEMKRNQWLLGTVGRIH